MIACVYISPVMNFTYIDPHTSVGIGMVITCMFYFHYFVYVMSSPK